MLRKTPQLAWFSTLLLYLVFLCLAILTRHEWISSVDGLSASSTPMPEWIYWNMAATLIFSFVMQLALYEYTRYEAEKGRVSEDLRTLIIGVYSVALSTWLTYAMLYGLLPAPVSLSVKLVLATSLSLSILTGLQTSCVVSGTRMTKAFAALMHKHIYTLMIVVFALVLYLSFLSYSLSEWDSVSFAQALERFDMRSHQPHAPGYALYVFLGRVASVISGDRILALTSVSAISGALGLLPTHAIVRRMYDSQTATVTILALLSTRMYWLSSEKAVTNILATFLMTTAICLLYLGMHGEQSYFLMSWPIAGLALGARPSSFPFLILWFYATVRQKQLKNLPVCLVIFSCSIMSWFAPTILLTGLEKFLELVTIQYDYIASNEFVGASYGMQPIIRFAFMLIGLVSYGMGAPIQLMYMESGPLLLHHLPSILILFILTALLLMSVGPSLRGKWSVKKTFMFLWIIPYSAFVYLVSNPSYPRYFLPILPPIVITLVSVAWYKARLMESIGRQGIKRKLLCSLVIVLILCGFVNSARLAATIHTTPVPMVQLTQYIKANYDRNTVLVIGFHEYKAFQYYLSGYRYFSAQYQVVEVSEVLRNISSNQTVLITETSIRYILGPQIQRLGLMRVEIARFEMDPHVETEQHTIILYRLVSAV